MANTEHKVIAANWNQIADQITKEVDDGWKVIGFSIGEIAKAFALLERTRNQPQEHQ